MTHESEAVADLVEHRLAIRDRWRRGFLSADGHEQDRRYDIGHGVDGDRDRTSQQLDEDAAEAEPGELRDRATRCKRAVRFDQTLALDDGRQERVVRRVEEARQHGLQGRHRQ